MGSKAQPEPLSLQWLCQYQPFTFLLVSLPSVTHSERRWAAFQVILSVVFALAATAIGVLAIDTSRVGVVVMWAAVFLLGLSALGFSYAAWLGTHWYGLRRTVDNDAEAKRIERDDRLHDDMVSLVNNISAFTAELKAEREARTIHDAEQRNL